MAAAGGAAAATAAAAAAAAAAQQEEEEMTPYGSAELAENWEFKILRCVTPKFRDAVFLHTVLEQEARAGWILVEKFDDNRVRLKRPASARRNDATLGFDPYRTWVGMSQNRFGLWLVLGIFGAMGVLAGIGIVIAMLVK
jgi:hypothetical protein